MLDSILKGFYRALKSGLITALVWTCLFSAVLWFFSNPSIPYFNFVKVIGPYSLGLFGLGSLIFESLILWLEQEKNAPSSAP